MRTSGVNAEAGTCTLLCSVLSQCPLPFLLPRHDMLLLTPLHGLEALHKQRVSGSEQAILDPQPSACSTQQCVRSVLPTQSSTTICCGPWARLSTATQRRAVLTRSCGASRASIVAVPDPTSTAVAARTKSTRAKHEVLYYYLSERSGPQLNGVSAGLQRTTLDCR